MRFFRVEDETTGCEFVLIFHMDAHIGQCSRENHWAIVKGSLAMKETHNCKQPQEVMFSCPLL